MYIPILKGRRGEFTAWSKLKPSTRPEVRPVFEIAPNNGGELDILGFGSKCESYLSAGDRIAVDAVRYVPKSEWVKTSNSIYTSLQTKLSAIGATLDPVIELDSSLDQVKDAIHARSANGGITLRISDEFIDNLGGDEDQQVPDPAVVEKWEAFQITPRDLDLLIDLGGVHGTNPTDILKVANSCVQWAIRNGPWKSIALASGAFPQQITAVPVHQAYRISRDDAKVWNLINQAYPHLSLDYGDYGIKDGYPPRSGGGFPFPNIRYTTDADWIVWREKALTMYPNSSIYVAYAGVVALPDFRGGTFSWSDSEILTKSTRSPGPDGAGGGEQWLCYGFNHHIELVVDRLTNQGVA